MPESMIGSISVSRRRMIKAFGVAALGSAVSMGTRRTRAADTVQAPKVKIGQPRSISQQPNLYHGWPTVTQRANGELLLVCSGGRESHVCPFGRVELMRSKDKGKTWSFPRVLIDGPIDDRDAGVVETAKGSILVTTFTSLAYEPILSRALKIKPGSSGAWSMERLEQWNGAHGRISAQQRKAELGCWMIRSTDGGLSFSSPSRVPVNSPHGPVQLSDGRLLYAGKELWHGENRIGVWESIDDGQNWKWLATIPSRDGDDHRQYHELHLVEASERKLVVQIRNHNKANARETLQCYSTDGGKRWSKPRSIGVWGLPSHLLRLSDGKLLMSYGHRRAPLGVQARISEDQGKTWSQRIVLHGKGVSGDLGYPSTVQFDDGSLLTVWYERISKSPKAVLRQVDWSLES